MFSKKTLKRRIAIWTHGGIGGGFALQGQPNIQRLVHSLADDFEIDVFSLMSPSKDFRAGNFRIISCPSQVKWRLFRWIWLFIRFMITNRRSPYELLYAFWGYPSGIPAVVFARLYGIRSVIHLQGGDAANVPSIRYGVFVNPFRARLCRYFYAQCDVLIALTSYQAQSLRRNGVQRNCVVIPYDVDEKLFSFRHERLTGPVVRFLHVANLTAVKDQLTLLRTFAEITRTVPATLTIVGEDFFNGQLKKWCEGLRIEDQVVFEGPVWNADLPGYYYNADILLHTSLYEGQGLVFSEAASCGTLIAGTKCGLLWDMETDCAIRVPVGDWQFLSARIIDVLNDRDQYDSMRLRALQWVRRHGNNYTHRSIKNVIESNLPAR